jgi:dolichol-phosphate mannosyltransferase
MRTVLVVPTYNEAEGILTVPARPHGEPVQLDADLSHSPQRIPALLEALQGVDVTIAFWYVSGGGVVNWSLSRRIISRVGNLPARLVQGVPVRDATAGTFQYRTRGRSKMSGDMVREAMLRVLIRRWRQITQGKHCIVDRGNTRATA